MISFDRAAPLVNSPFGKACLWEIFRSNILLRAIRRPGRRWFSVLHFLWWKMLSARTEKGAGSGCILSSLSLCFSALSFRSPLSFSALIFAPLLVFPGLHQKIRDARSGGSTNKQMRRMFHEGRVFFGCCITDA